MTTYVKADGTLTNENRWEVDESIVKLDLSVLLDGLNVYIPPGGTGGSGSSGGAVQLRRLGKQMPRTGEKVRNTE